MQGQANLQRLKRTEELSADFEDSLRISRVQEPITLVERIAVESCDVK